jgi:hypothetical protein
VGEFVIAIDDPRRDDVRRLLEQHRRFASSVMPPEGVHVLAPDDPRDENVTWFSVRVGGELLGIGALKELDAEHAELKSMHTAAAARGRGVACAGRPPPRRGGRTRDSTRQPRVWGRRGVCPGAIALRRGRVRAVRTFRRVQGDPGQRVHDPPRWLSRESQRPVRRSR